jgi:hypothetical protein
LQARLWRPANLSLLLLVYLLAKPDRGGEAPLRRAPRARRAIGSAFVATILLPLLFFGINLHIH